MMQEKQYTPTEILAAFCDVATELGVRETSQVIDVQMSRDAQQLKIQINKVSGQVTVKGEHGTSKMPSLRSLIASEIFANIQSFVDTQERLFKRDLDAGRFNPDNLIEPSGDLDSKDLDFSYFCDSLAPQSSNRGVSLMLLDGPAGVGKTSLVRRLMVHRCQERRHGVDVPPVLHVLNRGKGLATLTNILAHSTQTSGAKFTYSQVPILVSMGLIQVCIDGFDELADPSGYKDAWEALRNFIDDVRVGGPVILAGRDTFFDAQSFIESLNASRASVSLSRARLKPVSKSVAVNYLVKNEWERSEVEKLEKNDFLAEEGYALRPYFLSVLATMSNKSWKTILDSGAGPKYFLIDAMVNREKELIADVIKETEGVDSRKIFETFLGGVAVEMAGAQTDAIDLPYLELIAETQLKDVLHKNDLGRFIGRIGSVALLEQDKGAANLRCFTHSEIYNYYLTWGMIEEVSSGTISAAVRRGDISIDFIGVLIDTLAQVPDDIFAAFTLKLHQELLKEPYGRFAQNLGTLVLATLEKEVSNVQRSYSNLSLDEAVFPRETESAEFSNCFILRLDVRGSDLTHLQFDDSSKVATLVMDGSTRLPKNMMDVSEVEMHAHDGIKYIRVPDEINDILKSEEDDDDELHNAQAVKVFDRLCRVFLRQHWIRMSEEDLTWRPFMNEPHITDIFAILKDNKRIVEETQLPTGGGQAVFFHIKEPLNFLDSSRMSEEEVDIWKAIGSLPE